MGQRADFHRPAEGASLGSRVSSGRPQVQGPRGEGDDGDASCHELRQAGDDEG